MREAGSWAVAEAVGSERCVEGRGSGREGNLGQGAGERGNGRAAAQRRKEALGPPSKERQGLFMWGLWGAALRTGHPGRWGNTGCKELHTWKAHLEALPEVQMKKQLVRGWVWGQFMAHKVIYEKQ